MFDDLTIKSKSGPYEVNVRPDLLNDAKALSSEGFYYIVDQKVANIYQDWLPSLLKEGRVTFIEATEENKSIEQIIPVIKGLIAKGVKRNHKLVAIGGGVIQDITCFIASTLFRGLDWYFVPTTLLAHLCCRWAQQRCRQDPQEGALP